MQQEYGIMQRMIRQVKRTLGSASDRQWRSGDIVIGNI